MFRFLIYKDKLAYTSWNEEKQDWIETPISDSEPITKYFDMPVEIRESILVEDLMNHLAKYETDIDYCFASYTNGVPFKLFLEDMKKEEASDEVEEIELFWFGEIMNNDLVILGNMRGWLNREAAEKKGLDADTPYSVEYTPISVWKKSKFTLNSDIIITDFGEPQSSTEEVVFEGTKPWSLFDFMSNFLFELTSSGSPEEAREVMKSIQNMKYDLHEVSKDKEQAKFWLGFLESQIEEIQEDINTAIEEERYEVVSGLKKNLDDIKQEIGDLRKEIAKVNSSKKTDEHEE